MRIAEIYKLVFTAIITIAASGCSPFPEAQRTKSDRSTHDALAGVPLSEPLSLKDTLIGLCDEELAFKVLLSSTKVNLANVDKVWGQCQLLYSCSPTTQNFLKESFASGNTFRLGFTDLKSIGVSTLGERVSALYVSNTGKIYIDTSVTSVSKTCPLLLHELVHRFDPKANPGAESLDAEFRAYWFQEMFGQELYALGEQFQTAARDYVHWMSREKLLADVAGMYGFTVDRSLLDKYGPLPMEQSSVAATHHLESEFDYIVD